MEDNSSKTGLSFFVSMFLHSSVIALLALGPSYLPKLLNKNEPPSTTIDITPVAATPADMRTIVTKEVPTETKSDTKPLVKKTVAKNAPTKNKSKAQVLPQKAVDVSAEDKLASEDNVAPEAEQVVAKEDTKEDAAMADDKKAVPQAEDVTSENQEAAPVVVEDAKSGEQEEVVDSDDPKTKASDDEFSADKAGDKQKKNNADLEKEAIASAAAAAPVADTQKPPATTPTTAATTGVSAINSMPSATSASGNSSSSSPAATQNYLGLRQMPGNQPPAYSRDMRLNQMQGQGQLVYFVSKDGHVSHVNVTKSTGHPELDQAAVSAFSKYHFVPGQEGYTVHDFEFSLKGPATNEPGRLRTSTQQ